jgi:tetratricopeptide (TPR) repeat protein
MSVNHPNCWLSFFSSKICLLGTMILLGQILIFAQPDSSRSLADSGRPLSVKVRDERGQEREVELYEGSYALIIGNSNYSNGWSKLPSVAEDLDEVGKTLEKKGFLTEFARDVSRDEFRYRLETFINTHGLKAENQLLIYFAGHGYTEKVSTQEVGYIVMTDAPLPEKNISLFRQRAIEMSEIESLAKRIKAKHALFVFDSCFSGSLMRNRGQKPSPFISSVTIKPVREFITSGSAEQVVPDKSVFRVFFQRALGGEADYNDDKYITGSELGLYLQQKVADYTENAQTPQFSKIRDIMLDEGDFVFSLMPYKTSDIPARDNCLSYDFSQPGKYVTEGKFDLAIALFNKAIAANGKCGGFYTARGTTYLLKSEVQQALKDFTKALEIDAQSYQTYLIRGVLYAEYLKDNQKGIADYDKAIELCTKAKSCTYDYLIRRAKLNEKLEEYDKAILDFTRAIEMKPLESATYQQRGLIYLLKKKDMNLAYADFDRAISLDPYNGSNYHNRAITLFVRGTNEKNNDYYVKSIKDFDRAIELDPNSPDSYDLRAHVWGLLGETEKAEADKRKFEELKKKRQ